MIFIICLYVLQLSPESAKGLEIVTGLRRRRLSSAVMRANVQCLLERLVMVGEGQGQAGQQRQWARAGEERGRGETWPEGEISPQCKFYRFSSTF